MGMILKSNVIEGSNPRMSRFNLTDVRVEAAAIVQRACDQLDAAKKQAEDIVEHAKTQVEGTRQQAQAEGFQSGHAQGILEGKKEGRQQALEEARKEFAEQNRQLRTNLEQVFSQFETERNHLMAQAHQDLLALALAIARKVTYRQLEIDPGIVIDNVKTAVNLVGSRSLVEVKMNPQDIERFNLLDEQNAAKLFNLDQIKVITDEHVELGGCVITTNNGKIDAQVSTQLQNLTHQLAPVMEQQVKTWAGNGDGDS
jgi:flagellar biosynthesis/type III secretory pathway protein FliH